jgi:ketosteroid isomerase-like protein
MPFADPGALEVWATVRAMNDAWTRDDGSTLVAFFHPRMVAIAPGVRRPYVGREACVAAWMAFAASTEIRGWREIDPRIELFGDTAVVTYDYEMSAERGGHPVVLRGRDMLTLRREDGRWWLIADQFSPLPGE